MNMYRHYIGLLVCLFLCTTLMSQKGYNIDVTVKNFDGTDALLANYFGDKNYKADSTEVENGHFVFSGDEPLKKGMYLVVLPPANNYFELIIDEDQHFSIATELKEPIDFVRTMKVDGSDDNSIFYNDLVYIGSQRQRMNEVNEKLKGLDKNSAEAKELTEQLNKINTEVMTYRENLMNSNPDMLFAKMLKALKNPVVPPAPPDADSLFAFNYYRSHFFDEVDFNDQRLLRTTTLHQRADIFLEKLTYKHPDSIAKSIDYIIDQTQDTLVFRYFVQTYLNKYAESKIMGMDAVYVHMVEKYYMTGRAYWVDDETLKKMIERALAISPTLIGRKAPNFTMKDHKGNLVTLHNIKAKYTILYFWDYDCGHCKKVTPQLAEAYEKYIDKDVQLITVSINGSIEVWKNKLGEYGIKGIPLADPSRKSGFDAKYDVRSTPRLFVLDEDKIIKAKHITVEQMEDLLNRFLGLPPIEREVEEEKSDKE